MVSTSKQRVRLYISVLGATVQVYLKLLLSIRVLTPIARMLFRFIHQLGTFEPGKPASFLSTDSSEFKLLILVPPSWSDDKKAWAPAQGNYYFDIWQSARELYGEQAVYTHQIRAEDEFWVSSTTKIINELAPSHIMFHVEDLPLGGVRSFLDFGMELNLFYKGQLTLLMYDSIFWNHLFIAEAFAEVFNRTSVLATDRFPKELRINSKAGPAPLPTSNESLIALEEKYASTKTSNPEFNVSFIGRVYGYRKLKLRIAHLLKVDIATNPHKLPGSNSLPEFIEYYSAFRNSIGTVNWARANGSLVKHAKTRILEAVLFQTILITDERKITKTIVPEDAFVFFRNSLDLKIKITKLLNNPELMKLKMKRSQESADFVKTLFWRKFESLNTSSDSREWKRF